MKRRALFSEVARHRKEAYFLDRIGPDAKVLEVGSANGWAEKHLRARGRIHYTGLDLHAPANIVGDIRNWKTLGLESASFDVIIAFEVVEHVNCFQEFHDLLKPGGLLMLTSPVPSMDWLCRWLERRGLNQQRTSPHDHLIRFRDIPLFEPLELRTVGLIAQWGIFRKADQLALVTSICVQPQVGKRRREGDARRRAPP